LPFRFRAITAISSMTGDSCSSLPVLSAGGGPLPRLRPNSTQADPIQPNAERSCRGSQPQKHKTQRSPVASIFLASVTLAKKWRQSSPEFLFLVDCADHSRLACRRFASVTCKDYAESTKEENCGLRYYGQHSYHQKEAITWGSFLRETKPLRRPFRRR
jgi:hypothetical protein